MPCIFNYHFNIFYSALVNPNTSGVNSLNCFKTLKILGTYVSQIYYLRDTFFACASSASNADSMTSMHHQL